LDLVLNTLTLIAMFELEFVVGKWTLHNIFTRISLVFSLVHDFIPIVFSRSVIVIAFGQNNNLFIFVFNLGILSTWSLLQDI
jgi:hypothetical protein